MDFIFSSGTNDIYFLKSDFNEISFLKKNISNYYKFSHSLYGPSFFSFLGSKVVTKNGDVILSSIPNICYVYTGNYNSTYKLKQTISGRSGMYNNLQDFTLSNDNSTIIIGGSNSFNSGYIDIYTGNVSNGWKLKQTISGGTLDSKFGEGIQINDDKTVIFVGDSADNNSSGIVSIYTGTIDTEYILKQKIYGSGLQFGNRLGASIATNLDGSEIAIGAVGENRSTGIIHIYTGSNTNGWAFKQYITGENNGQNEFGRPIYLNQIGNTLIAGTQYPSSSRGGALVYTKNELGNWIFNQKISGNSTNSSYGAAITFSEINSNIVIGGPMVSRFGASNIGAAMILSKNNLNQWSTRQIISGKISTDYLGQSVSLSFDGKILAIGVPNFDTGFGNEGSIDIYRYVYE